MMRDERVGSVHRAQVTDLLSRALAEGYLSLDEFDRRQVAVTSATLNSELLAQMHDMPPQFQWDPRVPVPTMHSADDRNVKAFATTALILGVTSIPMSLCLAGWVFGIAAIFFSVPGSRGGTGWSKALIGRVLGIIGIVLSIGVLAIVLFAPKES
jgi:hypothetical protein